jgi:MFS transporter, PAT family, beta-lactamase induction signal transducer AmpG
VGSLGRAAIGEAIDQMGYAPVFRFTALIGLIAVGFVIIEWIRDRASRSDLADPAASVDGATAAPRG